MTKVDFHTHTTCSDGILTPEEMINRAYSKGLNYYSITDHDTVSALDTACEISKNLDMTFIPGIELSTNHNNESIHILGFFKDSSYNKNEFIDFVNSLKNQRTVRAAKMVQKLKSEYNINISFEKVLLRGKDVVARPHIAQEIIESGYDYSIQYIFDNLIGKGCKAYVPSTKLSTRDGIAFLKRFNALVFLAHPILIEKSPLNDFLKMDFDGIEAVYYQNTDAQQESLVKLAKDNNLLISAGSDFHGNLENDTRHGDIGSMSKNYKHEYLESFIERFNS